MLPQPEGALDWQVPTRCCSLLLTVFVTWAPLLVMEEPILLSTCTGAQVMQICINNNNV